MHRAALVVSTLALLAAPLPALETPPAAAPVAAPDQHRVLERTLDNGVRVIAIDVPGSGMVGVETFYSVGIAHDPPGIPQLTHLLEHIMVRGATGERAPDEAMNRLNAIGMHNAETMGSATHYDYAAPATELETILDIERDRLNSLVIDRAIIEQEFPRCAAELTNIERLPQVPVGKFALMAAHQVWRTRGERVSILRHDAPPEAIARAHAGLYRPDALRVVIVGDVRVGESSRLAEDALGTLAARAPMAQHSIDWLTMPLVMESAWDGSRDVVIVAFPPPTDPLERAVLTLWGGVLMQQLSMMPVPGAVPGSLLTTSGPFPVGDSPFFVCAVPAEGVALEDLAGAIRGAIRSARDHKQSSLHAGMIVASASPMLRSTPPAPARVRAQADQLLRFRGLGEDQRPSMTGLVLLNHALQTGIHAMLTEGLPAEDRARLLSLSGDQLALLLDRALEDQNARVLLLRRQ